LRTNKLKGWYDDSNLDILKDFLSQQIASHICYLHWRISAIGKTSKFGYFLHISLWASKQFVLDKPHATMRYFYPKVLEPELALYRLSKTWFRLKELFFADHSAFFIVKYSDRFVCIEITIKYFSSKMFYLRFVQKKSKHLDFFHSTKKNTYIVFNIYRRSLCWTYSLVSEKRKRERACKKKMKRNTERLHDNKHTQKRGRAQRRKDLILFLLQTNIKFYSNRTFVFTI
jgi:hypothetical protein